MSKPSHFGLSYPLGATLRDGGANFSLYSRTATGVELLFFNHVEDARPAQVVQLDPADNRTYHYWHCFVPGVQAGLLYGYRVLGPNEPSQGLRFDASKLLLDPYGKGVVVPGGYNREAATEPGDNAATAMKSVVVDSSAYDWEDDAPPHHPSARTVIYEMHVRAFTANPNSGVKQPGTYAGLIEKIPYLQSLGVTAIELMPVHEFPTNDFNGQASARPNYWGYDPIAFFAPHLGYQAGVEAGGVSLRELVTVQFVPHGVTGTAVVGESHLSIHTWPEEGRAFVDVASCKDREGVTRAVAAMLEAFPGARLATLDERELG
ncbi:MAG TPA: S-adenosylmethionine decarboxylase [Gemmatales bacterium]|nr:S-adenosylmethionine decarboxylase [Gemmatales bacterium]